MWLSTRAKITGFSHERNGLPCQDFAERDMHDNCMLCVVSDGASSAPLGEIGASIAIESIKHYFRYKSYKQVNLNTISSEIKDIFNMNIQKKINELNYFVAPYYFAATVAFVVIYEKFDSFYYGIIGDCAVTSIRKNGLIKTESGCKIANIYTNKTNFITDGWSDFFIFSGRLSDYNGFIITTDGCLNSGLLTQSKQADKVVVDSIFENLTYTQNPEIWLENFINTNFRKFSTDDLSMFVIYNNCTKKFNSYKKRINKKCENSKNEKRANILLNFIKKFIR